MLGRLAWGNVRSGEHGVRTYLLVSSVASATFYAFNTIEEQQCLIVGGSSFPPKFGGQVGLLTLVLAGIVGVVGLLLSRCVTMTDDRQLSVLRMLGAGRTRLALLLLVEQGIAWLIGLVVGLVLGVLLSHALVFISAWILSGTVEGFRPFLSVRALVTSVVGLSVDFLIAVGGSHITLLQQERQRARRGRLPRLRGAVWPSLLGALLCISGAYGLFSRAGIRHGPWHVLRLAICLAPLWLGTFLLLRGMAEAVDRWSLARRTSGRMAGMESLAITYLTGFGRQSAGSVSLFVVGLVTVLVAGAWALGGQGSFGGSLYADLTACIPPGQASRIVENADSLSYRALFTACVLLPVLMALLFTLVLGHVGGTARDYRILMDLGCPRSLVERSISQRVALAFAVPVALAFVQVVVVLLVGGPYLSPKGFRGMALGLLMTGVAVALLLRMCAAFTRRHCFRVMRHEMGAGRLQVV